jgi:hypothetical protein
VKEGYLSGRTLCNSNPNAPEGTWVCIKDIPNPPADPQQIAELQFLGVSAPKNISQEDAQKRLAFARELDPSREEEYQNQPITPEMKQDILDLGGKLHPNMTFSEGRWEMRRIKAIKEEVEHNILLKGGGLDEFDGLNKADLTLLLSHLKEFGKVHDKSAVKLLAEEFFPQKKRVAQISLKPYQKPSVFQSIQYHLEASLKKLIAFGILGIILLACWNTAHQRPLFENPIDHNRSR